MEGKSRCVVEGKIIRSTTKKGIVNWSFNTSDEDSDLFWNWYRTEKIDTIMRQNKDGSVVGFDLSKSMQRYFVPVDGRDVIAVLQRKDVVVKGEKKRWIDIIQLSNNEEKSTVEYKAAITEAKQCTALMIVDEETFTPSELYTMLY